MRGSKDPAKRRARCWHRKEPMQDPKTTEEWQAAVNGANFLLELESCRMYGLIKGGPTVNLDRCESILDSAKNRDITPRKLTDEEICRFLQDLNAL